ncbi:hypothetical protein BLNAU_4797 [Blattamonas nauphoetae]|uniref:Uncharacterized protein n=1 Tax=Blattamonas nauphoetae TaxID=2049346 RepID=A0ABQ9Y9B1_9EUKA|nr:hypothetical protein BLNAU_4797 [Blattamonas nauphoetae]
MEIVLRMPVFLAIPSYLAYLENDESIRTSLSFIVDAQQNWNNAKGEERQMGKTMHRMLRMEGIEDAIEAKLQNNKNGIIGRWIVARSRELNNMLGTNLPKQE